MIVIAGIGVSYSITHVPLKILSDSHLKASKSQNFPVGAYSQTPLVLAAWHARVQSTLRYS